MRARCSLRADPLEDQDFATSCVVCPLNSYTFNPGAFRRADCVCNKGFYDANATTDIDHALIANLHEVKKDPRSGPIVQARADAALALVIQNSSAAVVALAS